MKLRNKTSGEIKEFVLFDGNELQGGVTLKNLAQEWEDVPEEPKERYWVIDDDGMLVCRTVGDFTNEEMCKQIGNYFETKEEAEKAVEKLKAWKRLKDIGCRFVLDDNFTVKFVGPEVTKIVSAEEGRILCDDYRLLFGGEE